MLGTKLRINKSRKTIWIANKIFDRLCIIEFATEKLCMWIRKEIGEESYVRNAKFS